MATLQLIQDFVGRTIGNYFVEEKIGDGGYGTVYRARHLTLKNRVVAIKVLKPEAAHDPALLERFQNEANAAASIAHPGIVRVDDIGEDAGTHYIVMEHLQGMDLQQWLAPHREGLPIAEVVALLYDVADLLDAAHKKPIIHRDLKPENLFRTKEGLVKILDWGIAKLSPDIVGSFRTATNVVLGSPGYFAPEFADPKRATPIDRRCDVFSLAAVAYELLTHDKPWHFNDPWQYVALIQQADEKRPRYIRILRPELPEAAARAVMAGLSKNPNDRPSTAGDFVQALADSFPQGAEIVEQRKEALRAARAAQGLPPPPAAPSPSATRSRTPRLEGTTAAATPTPVPTPTPALAPAPVPALAPAPVATSAADAEPTLRVRAAVDPSRIPTLVPKQTQERIPTFVPKQTQERIPTLVPEPVPALPTGPIPELVVDSGPAPAPADTALVTAPAVAASAVTDDDATTADDATAALHDDADDDALDSDPPSATTDETSIVSGTVAASRIEPPSTRVESSTVLLDSTLIEHLAENLATAPPIPAPAPSASSTVRALVVAAAVVAAGTIGVLIWTATRSSNSAAETMAPAPTLAADASMAVARPTPALDAAPAEPSAPADGSTATLEPPASSTIDAAQPSPDAATPPPERPPSTHAPQPGKVEVFANEPTDVFIVSGSRPKFLGTTPLPRASVPAGTVTLELRSRGRKVTRKVTVRPGLKARVDHTWSSN